MQFISTDSEYFFKWEHQERIAQLIPNECHDTFFQTYCYVFILCILEKVLQECVENLYLHFKIKKYLEVNRI